MSDIIIKITIPEGEYKQWNEFDKGGVDEVKKELRSDFLSTLNSLSIHDADLEIYLD